ncbi:MAG: hypothetical protein HC896_04880 [Bacteroidales bacterium]|nr:hypothetical protein [Bacteroidales bacterium]
MKRIFTMGLLLAGCFFGLLAQSYGDIGNVTDIDSNVYETKYLNDNNWWMMENLKVRHKPDGTDAGFVFPFNGTINDETLVDKGAGLLYDRDMLLGFHTPNVPRACAPMAGMCPQ